MFFKISKQYFFDKITILEFLKSLLKYNKKYIFLTLEEFFGESSKK